MKIFILLLFTVVSFSQEGIVTGGNSVETFGAVFPVIQEANSTYKTNTTGTSLVVPKFDPPTEIIKPIDRGANKKSFFEKFITFIKRLMNKKK